MNQVEFNSTDYITLKQFQGGWIWIKNINAISNQILQTLQRLSTEEVRSITDLLNGDVLPWPIFDDTRWVIRFVPLPDFIILIVFNYNVEFGSALRIFYHKSSLIVPTEDAYVFTEIFLRLLESFAKDGIAKTTSTQFQDDLISLHDLLKQVDPINKEKIWNNLIGQREAPLLKIDKTTAKQISKNLKIEFFTGTWQNKKLEWGLKFIILKNLSLYAILTNSKTEFQIIFTKNILNYKSHRILFFTWLYCNAIIREARLILGDILPKLSDYL
ncbi:MAG: hypothetical protein ACFFD2_13855 [Promethearchaeota archaeon]